MSHLVCYTIRIKEIKNMKMKMKTEIQQDPKTGKRTLVTVPTDELTFQGVTSDETETFTGWRNDSFGNDCRDHDQDAWNFEIDESDCWK